MRIYAIGDIHGHLDQLKAAHARIAVDRAQTGDADASVVHLGDLVDRGPDARGVIEYLIEGIARGEPWVVLKGNHDQCFAAQLGIGQSVISSYRSWTSSDMGGASTAASYGVEFDRFFGAPSEKRARAKLSAAVPEAHKAFLASLPVFHAAGELIFVHAGIRPGIPMDEQIEEDLLWIRRDFLMDRRDHGALIVHGHTPVEAPMHCGNRVNLDTGAGYGRPITAAVFEGRDAWVLRDDGRVPLTPG